MDRRSWACVTLVVCLLLAIAPPVSATAVASGTAKIDWSTVSITPVGSTTLSYFTFWANGMTWANYNNPALRQEQNQQYSGFDSNVSQAFDFNSANRTVSLLATIDMVNKNQEVGSASASSDHAGDFQDLAWASESVYVTLGGDKKIRIQGDYSLDASASAGAGESAMADPAVGLFVYDELHGGFTYLNKSWDLLTTSGSQSTPGHFDETVTVTTDENFRVQFIANVGTEVKSPVPAPEPASLLMLAVGVLAISRFKNKIAR